MGGKHVVLGAALLLAHIAHADDVKPPSETPPVGPPLLIDNPYVEPAELSSVYGSFYVDHDSLVDAVTGTGEGFTTEGLGAGFGFGASDRLTLGLQYSAPLFGDNTDEDRFLGPIVPYVMYLVAHTDRLAIAATADLAFDLCGGSDLMGHCNVTTALRAGVGVRYKLAERLAVYTGQPIGPSNVGQQLYVSLSGGPVALRLPVGLAAQASANTFAFLGLRLARINFAHGSGDAVDVVGSRALGVPLTIGGYYRLGPRLHLGLGLDLDLAHAGDDYDLAFALRWYQ